MLLFFYIDFPQSLKALDEHAISSKTLLSSTDEFSKVIEKDSDTEVCILMMYTIRTMSFVTKL